MRILIILFSLVAVACSTRHIGEIAESKAAATQSIRWQTDSTFDDRSGPNGSILLVIGSKTFPLKIDRPVAFRPLSRENHVGWGVPMDADIAALGWYAGYGEVLYTLRTHDEVKVYYREVEEQVTPPPFKLIKRIPIEK
jgi:hypothetical protein